MTDSKLDGRKWKFLNNPEKYNEEKEDNDINLEPGKRKFLVEPLRRQFKTAKEILERFQDGRGVLLADDVGLGKTTVGGTRCVDCRLPGETGSHLCAERSSAPTLGRGAREPYSYAPAARRKS